MKLTDATLANHAKDAADRLTLFKLRQYERIVSGRQFTDPPRMRGALPALRVPRYPKEPTT